MNNSNDDYTRYDNLIKDMLKSANVNGVNDSYVASLRNQLIAYINNYLYSQLDAQQLQRIMAIIDQTNDDGKVLDYLESIGIDVIASEDRAIVMFKKQYLASLTPATPDEKFMSLFDNRNSQNA